MDVYEFAPLGTDCQLLAIAKLVDVESAELYVRTAKVGFAESGKNKTTPGDITKNPREVPIVGPAAKVTTGPSLRLLPS
jgi:hypothetical protein